MGHVSCCDWACFGQKYLTGVLEDLVYGKWDKEKKEIVYNPERKANIEARNVKNLGEGDCRGARSSSIAPEGASAKSWCGRTVCTRWIPTGAKPPAI